MLTAEYLQHGPQLKLDRAIHHINDLKARAEAFLAEKPFKLMRHYRPQTGETAFWSKPEKPIPAEFSLIIGDAIHNLRAALDLTLYPMAKDRADRPNRIMFPFAKDDTPKALADAMKEGRVKFAGKKVVEEIERLNPNPTGNSILWGIDAIDKSDKHRIPILTASFPIFTPASGSDKILEFALGDNPKGASVVIAGTEAQPVTLQDIARPDVPDFGEQEAETQPPFFIAFGGVEPFAYLPVLNQLIKGVHETASAIDSLIGAYLDPSNTFPS